MNLMELLQREHVTYAKDEHPAASTAIGLAIAEHVSGHQVVKPVIVEADGRMIMCALPANRRVDMSALRSILNARQLRMAGEGELADLCPGCELGAEPPIGRLFGMETLMDESLLDEDEVVFQAGTHHTALRIKRHEFERISQARLASFGRWD